MRVLRRHNRDAWQGVVIDKRRRLLDGANLYRTVTIDLGGQRKDVRVPRQLWRTIKSGDVLAKTPGKPPHKK